MFPGSSLMAAISSSAEEDRPGRSGRSVGLGAPRGAMTVTSQSARGASSRSGTPDDAFLGNRISSRACCLNAKSSEERVVYKKAELNRNVDSENNHGGSSRTYVLHRTGCSQEDDQLLRQGCERSGSAGRPDRSNTLGTGRLDEDASATLDRSHGSNDFHRLDLRPSAPARSAGEGSASADAARDHSCQEEERSHRCRQDRRLPALRLPAGMPHGIHRDSRQTPNPALPTPAGAPDGADEESDLRSADGNRSEPQQAAAAQSGVFP